MLLPPKFLFALRHHLCPTVHALAPAQEDLGEDLQWNKPGWLALSNRPQRRKEIQSGEAGLSLNSKAGKERLVTSLDKIPAVIAKALEKHNQERSQAPQYKLVQLLSEGQELAFPPTTNVFYAMNSSCQDFMLRAKQGKPAPLPPLPRTPTPKGVEISATFPKIKATGRKIAKALF
ncbi:ral guanine nucleotide dissociation stimulator-like 2 isoform X2 [Pogona vitticeps]